MRKVAAAIPLLLLFGCGKLNEITDPGLGLPAVDPTATFTRVQNEIFTPTCAAIGCHDNIGRQQNLRLVPGVSYSQIVGVPSEQMPSLRRVDPSSFADSYLYRKVTGVGISGERMPSSLPPLRVDEVALIRDWIRRGAPND